MYGGYGPEGRGEQMIKLNIINSFISVNLGIIAGLFFAAVA